jgi:effector-binding domain-containing protein
MATFAVREAGWPLAATSGGTPGPGGHAPTGSPVRACTLDATPAAVVRARVLPERIPGWLREAYRLVAAQLAVEGVAAVGPPFACYTSTGDGIEVEAGYPVPVAVAGDGVVVPSGLPGGPAAAVVHEGSLTALEAAYRRVEAWLAGHGFTARGRHWERYLAGGAGPDAWRTEIVVPYGWHRWVPTGDGGGRVVGTLEPLRGRRPVRHDPG